MPHAPQAPADSAKGALLGLKSTLLAKGGLRRYTCGQRLLCRVSGVEQRGDERVCLYCHLPLAELPGDRSTDPVLDPADQPQNE